MQIFHNLNINLKKRVNENFTLFFCICIKDKMNYTNLEFFKYQLNEFSGDTVNDKIMTQYLNVAELAVNIYCNGGLSGYTDITGSTAMPITVIQTMYLLATHFYINRTPVSFTQAIEIPFTIQFLLAPYRNLVII